MTIAEYLKIDIKKLYLATINENGINKEHRLKKFTTEIKVYYPWLTNKDLLEIIILVSHDENEYHRQKWKKKTISLYTKDIVKLFGILDKDNNSGIDIFEFKNAFKSINDISNEKLDALFDEADEDRNGTLDIIEFINFLSKYDEFKQHLTTLIMHTKEKQKIDNNSRLSIIFKDFPNSPDRINWRPSLTNLKSSMEIRKYLSKKKFNIN